MLTYQKLETLGGELDLKSIVTTLCVKEELDIVEKGIKGLNSNIEKIFGDKHVYFLLLFDYMLSTDGLNGIYKRTVDSKAPLWRGLDSISKLKIAKHYNQPPLWIFNVTGEGISLKYNISNFQLPALLRTTLQKVQERSIAFQPLAKELEQYIDRFAHRLENLSDKIYRHERKPGFDSDKLRKNLQGSADLYSGQFKQLFEEDL